MYCFVTNIYRSMIYLKAVIFTLLLNSFSLTDINIPSVELNSFSGETVNIREYTKQSKIQFISLWATWCGPCRVELDALQKVYPQWKKDYNVEIIAITLDNNRNLKRAMKMAENKGWDYTFFHDQNGILAEKLGITGIPYSLLVDKEGNVVSTSTGYYPGYEDELEKKIKSLYSKP